MQPYRVPMTSAIFAFLVCSIGNVNASLEWSRLGINDYGKKSKNFAYTFSNNIGYIFGGESDGKYNNDLLSIGANEKEWTKLNGTGNIPCKRSGATLTKIATSLYVIGGHNEHGTLSSIHKYDIIANKWYNVSPFDGFVLVSRTGHSACTDGRNRIFLFGGYNDDGLFLSDLYEVGIRSKHDPEYNSTRVFADVKLLNKDRDTSPNPLPRESASLIFIEEKLYLFGGYTYGGSCNDDMWIFDLKEQKWSRSKSSIYPQPSEGFSIITMGKSILLFGGCDFSYNVNRCYNDIWRYDTTDGKWFVVPTSLERPSERAFAMMAFMKDSIVLYGGTKLDKLSYSDSFQLLKLPLCVDAEHTCLGKGRCSGASCICDPGFEGHDCGIVRMEEDIVTAAETHVMDDKVSVRKGGNMSLIFAITSLVMGLAAYCLFLKMRSLKKHK